MTLVIIHQNLEKYESFGGKIQHSALHSISRLSFQSGIPL